MGSKPLLGRRYSGPQVSGLRYPPAPLWSGVTKRAGWATDINFRSLTPFSLSF